MRARIALALTCCLLLGAASSVPAAAAASRFVRLPAAASEALPGLDLAPRFAAAYGGFRWLELDEDDYRRLLASGLPFTEDEEAGSVQIVRYRFDPLVDGEPALGPGEAANDDGPGFHLVQFRGPVTAAWLGELAAAGLEPLQYYPHHAYLVWGAPAATEAAATLPFVRWQGRVHPAYKPALELDGRTGIVRNVDVLFYGEDLVEATLNTITKLGGEVLQHYPAQPDRKFFDAVVALPATAVAEVAAIPNVLWLGVIGPRPILDDEMSSQIVAGNHPGGVPQTGYLSFLNDTLGYDGTGVTWAVIDTGIDYDHPDLGSHIVGGYSFPGACNPAGQPGSDCSGGGHGTHVAGIIGGDATAGHADANGFLYGLGIAPGVGLFAMNSLSASAWPPAGGWQEHSKRAVLGGAIGGNNSWTTGEGLNHGYQASERTHDFMVRDGDFDTPGLQPFIEVFSAGNSGSGSNTLTAPKEAKNLIVTASSRNYRAGSIESISSFSSRGPAVDGRQVPTIAAPGEEIASTRNDTGGDCSTPIGGTGNLYSFCSGTSMASPHAAGAVALLTEWWRDLHAGDDPSPAMAKALLVNNAVEMTGAGGSRWNNAQGWGRINVANIIQPGVTTFYVDQSHLLTVGQSYETVLGVDDPAKPVKVTLAWTDAPGAAGANPALVNNLDLVVENGADTYRGNVFAGGWSTTGGTADNRNNLENVFIQSPAGSSLTIRVHATAIGGDGVPGNGTSLDQDFALVCTNCAQEPDFTLRVDPKKLALCAPADASFAVEVGSILGFANPVTLAATGQPAGSTATFSTNPVTPPGSSTLTIGNTGAAAVGSYTVAIGGTATGGTAKSFTVDLSLYDTAPAASPLTSPADGALNVPAVPTFTWNGTVQAATYAIEVATDAGFTNLVASASGLTSPTWTADVTLNTSTKHYWRVRAENACGTGAYSAVWSFTTVAAPGDCAPGSTPRVVFSEGYEGGLGSWTTPPGTGTNTWTLSTVNPHSGSRHVRGTDPSAISDQRLVSPPIALPAGENPVVLKFWHLPNMENSGSSACYDGGILEVTTNAGATWTQVPNSALLVGPYTGTVSSSFSNPLAGLQAWCGPTSQPYMNTIADVTTWAGQTVQFRWRIGSDSSVGRTGWDVDDIMVQSCSVGLFADGFESGNLAQWSATAP